MGGGWRLSPVATLLVQDHKVVVITSTSPSALQGIVDGAVSSDTTGSRKCSDSGMGTSGGVRNGVKSGGVGNEGRNAVWESEEMYEKAGSGEVLVGDDTEDYVIELSVSWWLSLMALPDPDFKHDKDMLGLPCIVTAQDNWAHVMEDTFSWATKCIYVFFMLLAMILLTFQVDVYMSQIMQVSCCLISMSIGMQMNKHSLNILKSSFIMS
jgi:hypothetical protein